MPEKTEKSIGEVVAQLDEVEGRSVKEWRDRVGEVRAVFLNMAEAADSRKDTGQAITAKHNAEVLQSLYNEMDRATRSWTRTKEELEARKAYVDLQNKVIEGWPKSAVADRLFYVGTGLFATSGVYYAVLGGTYQANALLLALAGIMAFVTSLYALFSYDQDRTRYFKEIRSRVR